MKKYVLPLIALSVACNSSQKVAKETSKAVAEVSSTVYAESITEEDLKTHLYIYASDEFEGRETGEPGQKKAVAYLKEQYEKLGIPAAKSDGDYFQNVPLEEKKVPSGSATIDGKTYNFGEDVLSTSPIEGSFSNVVYAGYGIEEGEYSDYKNIQVENKFVLIKVGEPINEDGTYTLTTSNEKSSWGDPFQSLGKRLELAEKKRARGVLYVDAANYGRFKSRFEFMKSNDSGSMRLKNTAQDDFSVLYVSPVFAKAIYSEYEAIQTPRALGKTVELNIQSTSKMIASENVAAVIKGSEKPNEYLVISSHLDHIGVNADGQVNNGADDDGSGTVALLEIAQAFKKAANEGNGPKRSIVFLHVTGEEKGLLGSQYYTDFDPIFPLENTVANLNIDMIGRIDPKREGERNYLYLIGSDKLSTELHNLSEEINTKYTNIEFDYTYNDENDPNRFYYRSDHYNFAKNNIPIIFYFNGTHEDYHQVGDTPDKINYDLLQNRSRLIFHTAWEISNREARIIVDKATN